MAFVASIAKCESEQGKWISSGPSLGSHESVAAIRHLAGVPLAGAPEPARWRRGKKVRGGHVPPGTAIATFPIKVDGEFRFKGHSAILLATTPWYLEVYEQFPGKAFGKRTIPFMCGGYVVNDRHAYYVIELEEHPSNDPALCGSTSNCQGLM